MAKKWFGGTGDLSDRELLEEIHKSLKDIQERVENLEEMFCDENGANKEFMELKAEVKEHNSFQRSMIMALLENKKANDAKPSGVELYMQQKKDREEKERLEAEAKKAKPNGGGPKLPG